MSRMTRIEWIAKHCKRHQRRKPSPRSSFRSPLFRPLHVERLEDRRMLAVITVDSLLDNFDPSSPTSDGVITLREAIVAANTDTAAGDAPGGSGADTIDFAGSLDGGTILLAMGEMEITAAVTIDATSLASGLAIDAQQNSRIFNITATTGDFTLARLLLPVVRRQAIMLIL